MWQFFHLTLTFAIILDKPGAPEGPLEVTDVHKDGCKLHWKKPKDDGDLPLTGYIVEKMDPTTGVWVPVSFLDPSKTDYEVTGLEPNKKYHFRVKAVNEEGESPPLETDSSILAKNPYGEFYLKFGLAPAVPRFALLY